MLHNYKSVLSFICQVNSLIVSNCLLSSDQATMFKKLLTQNLFHLKIPNVFLTQSNVCSITHFKHLHCQVCLQYPRHSSKPNSSTSPAIASKYEVITDDNSPIIEHTADEVLSEFKYPVLSDEFDGINLERGKNGVFELEDLVDLLKRENSKDIFVATVPKEINYVSYICIVSARSKRHIKAMSEFIRKVYKRKCHKSDSIPRIEGKDSDEWMAMDLGNIALHVFSDKARQIYDLETLWAVGPEYDEHMNKKSEVVEMFENYSAYLKDLKPLA